MVFSSLTFLFAYLPVTLAAYFLAPLRWRNLVLLLVSLFFYGWASRCISSSCSSPSSSTIPTACWWRSTGPMTARPGGLWGRASYSICCCWAFSSTGRSLLRTCICSREISIPEQVTLWEGFTIPLLNIPLPIGISFFTFQTMSYTIDVYRNDAPVQRSIVKFGTFVTMFPQLIAGPIVQYKTVAKELDHR